MSATAVARAIPAPIFLEDPPLAELERRVFAAWRRLGELEDGADSARERAYEDYRRALATWRGATGFLS